jgi:hypothetical protein
MTYHELADQMRRPVAILKAPCEKLATNMYLNAERLHPKPSIYTITSKGKRMLAEVDAPPVGKGGMPGPKFEPSRETYKPKPIVTRPGSDDHLRHPSRRGDERVPHSLPLTLAGGES